ncbi:354_t:CDS:2 [Paraglomus occultum]|uniref:354_t:CDS:1 n=1 Tax=Paraglomus occultum TaxID=144539 RepID=A0A9N9A7Y7_9GLOM|nr:354_t:CDS:2 [Paraglomus occultum]
MDKVRKLETIGFIHNSCPQYFYNNKRSPRSGPLTPRIEFGMEELRDGIKETFPADPFVSFTDSFDDGFLSRNRLLALAILSTSLSIQRGAKNCYETIPNRAGGGRWTKLSYAKTSKFGTELWRRHVLTKYMEPPPKQEMRKRWPTLITRRLALPTEYMEPSPK